MATAKKASAKKAPAKTADNNQVTVSVFVPRGNVAAAELKLAALRAAEDKIPPAAINVKVDIADVSDVKTVDGVDGREYSITVSYTPRKVGAHTATEPEEATVETVAATLQPLTPEKVADILDTGTEK